QLGNAPGDVRVDLDLEVVHALHGLMVFLAEGHLALGRVEAHAFHGGNQLVRVGVTTGLLERGNDGHARAHAAGGEEVRRRAVALLVLGHEPLVDRVLRDVVVVIGRAFHARELLVRGHGREDVAAGGDLDAVALEVEVGDLERVAAAAGPDDPDDLAARFVLERVDQTLRTGGEVGG